MTKKLHKIVNGDRFDLSEKEEIEMRKAWKEEDERKALRVIQRSEKLALKEGVKRKLALLGLTEEEIKLLKIK